MCCTALDRFCLETVSFEDPISLALYSNDCMGNSTFKYYLADVIHYVSISSFCADALRKHSWDMAWPVFVPVTAVLALSIVFRGTFP